MRPDSFTVVSGNHIVADQRSTVRGNHRPRSVRTAYPTNRISPSSAGVIVDGSLSDITISMGPLSSAPLWNARGLSGS